MERSKDAHHETREWRDEELNDRQDTTDGGREAQRTRFMDALRGAISETAAGAGGRGGGPGDLTGQFTSTDCLEAGTTAFTAQFRGELQLIAGQQLSRLDALSSRAATHDLFGLLRRRCEACQDGCPGYQPQGAMCPSGSRSLDFPTFCQNCGCPACFHLVVGTGGALPGPAAESITGFNMRQSELNFNALVTAFEIKEGHDWGSHVSALVTLLRAEGLEVLSLETRALDAREALHLRSRQLQAQDEDLSLLVNSGFDGDRARRAAEIRGAGKAQSVFSATARGDLAALEKEVRAREKSIQRKATRLLGSNKKRAAGATVQESAKENHNQRNLEWGSPERRNTFGGPDADEDDPETLLASGLQAAAGPRAASRWLTLASAALASSGPASPDEEGGDGLQARALSQLMTTIQASKELARMLVRPYLVMVVSSASQQNLGPRLRNELVPSYQRLEQEEVLRLAYISGSKIEAVEDAVTFAP